MGKSIQKVYDVTNLSTSKSFIAYTEKEATDHMLQSESNDKYIVIPTYMVVDSEKAKFRATIVMPIWEAPERTVRAINSVMSQDTNGWQLLCLGDGCDKFGRIMHGGWFNELKSRAAINGNEIIGINTEHFGGYGYHQRQLAKELARGEWTMFLDNDDVLTPHHLSTRLGEAGSDSVDILYFNTWIEPTRWFRDSQVQEGKIGHSEIMYRTELWRQLPALTDQYGHDWTQLKQALDKGATHRKGGGATTYIVKSLPNQREQGID